MHQEKRFQPFGRRQHSLPVIAAVVGPVDLGPGCDCILCAHVYLRGRDGINGQFCDAPGECEDSGPLQAVVSGEDHTIVTDLRHRVGRARHLRVYGDAVDRRRHRGNDEPHQ